MASTPKAPIGPGVRANVGSRFYPTVPEGKETVHPAHVNAALRFLTDSVNDTHEAFTALAQKLQTNSEPTGSVPANSSVQVTIPIPSPYPDTKYTATAGVVGASLAIGDVVKQTGAVLVTVINRDTVNPHSGTVSVIVMHQ